MDDPPPERGTLDELAALADELVRQAADVRQQWVELGETLGLEPAPAPRPAASPDDEEAPEPGRQWPEADPKRLVALDMMLSGRSRDEISEYLRATFGEEPDPAMLDEIFSDPNE